MRGVALLAPALVLAGCVAPVARERAPEAIAPPSAERSPPPLRPLATLIAQDPALSRFRSLAAVGDLAALVAGRAPVTILAPTDAAFARLPAGTVEALLLPGNRPSLRHLMRFWVVTGDVPHPAAGGAVQAPTLDGEPVTVTAGPDLTIVSDAAGRRGVANERHAIDGTLTLLDGVVAPRSIEPGR